MNQTLAGDCTFISCTCFTKEKRLCFIRQSAQPS